MPLAAAAPEFPVAASEDKSSVATLDVPSDPVIGGLSVDQIAQSTRQVGRDGNPALWFLNL